MNEIFHYRRGFGIRKDPRYLYGLFNILSKHATCEMEASQTQVYIQQ